MLRKRMNKGVGKTAVLLFLCCFFCWMDPGKGSAESASQTEQKIELYAKGAALIDGESGRLLYGKEEDVPLPMASTTKIMTCILALEYGELNQICEVSQAAASQPKVKLGMQTGDRFYLKDLLYSLMLESHNDTAVCVAEAVAGNVKEFTAWMNKKADEIGCMQTHFVTPNGLDGEDEMGSHHTTPRELALILRYCLEQSPKAQDFLSITQASSYHFSDVNEERQYDCRNHNALLTVLDGALSGKTGFTAKAGYCYVGAAKQDGKLLIVSLLACGWPNHKGYKWVDAKKLIRYGRENFERKEVTEEKVQTAPVQVENGKKAIVNTIVLWERPQKKDGERILLRDGERIGVQVELPERIEAPIEKGEILGTVTYELDGRIYAQYPVAAQDTVGKRDFGDYLGDCIKMWML